jgi:glycosyltransferase involved in cell wall biosynthesis
VPTRISAAMCTRNRHDSIRRAVDSVLANDHPDFELVIVDQSSSSETRNALQSLIENDSRLSYIHTTCVGLSAAYNRAIAETTGEIIGFTDDDCVAPTNWLRSIEAAFEENPESYLLYGQVLSPRQLNGVAGILPTLPFKTRRRLSRRYGFEIYGMGANFAARRSLFDRVGGFDEILGGGGPLRSSQDFDLQYRVYKNGLETLLEPNVVIDHYGIRTDVEWPQTIFSYGVGNGGFYMKHVRCGDLFAAWLLACHSLQTASRAAASVLHRRPNWGLYPRALIRGMRDSFNFDVDINRRLYRRSSPGGYGSV